MKNWPPRGAGPAQINSRLRVSPFITVRFMHSQRRHFFAAGTGALEKGTELMDNLRTSILFLPVSVTIFAAMLRVITGRKERNLRNDNSLRGVIDNAHFNDDAKLGKGKEMVDKLSGLIAIFRRPELDFKNNRVGNDDIIGDAYEYLMRKFATKSGKSNCKGMDRFSLRTKVKVNIQWLLYCMVHNIGKCIPRTAAGTG
jgi:hypothetical protein